MWVYPYLLQIKSNSIPIIHPISWNVIHLPPDTPIKYVIFVAKLGCLVPPHWMMPPSLCTYQNPH